MSSVYPLIYEDPILKNSILHEFISESAMIFKSIQSAAEEDISKEEIIRASRKYRAILHANFLKFDEKPSVSNEAGGRHLLKQMSILWHLCEILFLDINPPGFLVHQLLIWIRWHQPDILVDHLTERQDPHNDENYWPVIYKLIARGDVKVASKLLKLHPKYQQDEKEFSAIAELLDRMPQVVQGRMQLDFQAKWQSWSAQCRYHFGMNPLPSHERTILGIISADFETYRKNKHIFKNWYELMVTWLLYYDPFIQETDVVALSKECYADMQGDVDPEDFDQALLNAFSYDLVDFFQAACSALDDNSWFAAHIIDLLYHGHILDSNEIEEPSEMRQFFTSDYGSTLVKDPRLWEVGVGYLVSCPKYGLESLRLNLEHIPLASEEQALKIMETAQLLNFDDVYRTVGIVMARKFLAKEQLGPALLWAAKSKGPVLASHIADIFLKEYADNKKFPDEEVLDSLGSLMLTSDRLTFLVEYRKFLKLKEQKFFQEASSLLESLISSRIAPKFFVLTLLMDTISLLEAEMLVLNREQTYQILSALEDFTSSVPKELKEEFVEKEKYLSLALARNMARASVSPVS